MLRSFPAAHTTRAGSAGAGLFSMILTLEVVGEPARHLGVASRKVFHGIGGTIGRLPDNDWVFPDPYISGRHALIRYLNGTYFIEDTSTNGVFVNSPDNRVQRDQSYPLRDGDCIHLDAYRIKVSISRDPARAAQRDPFASLTARAAGPGVAAPVAGRNATAAGRPSQDDVEDDHDTEWFGATDVSAKLPDPSERGGSASSAESAQLRQLIEAGAVNGIHHSAAFAAAMRVAFEATLAHFDPDLLQQDFERHKSKRSTGTPAKQHYWDLYRDRYQQLLRDRENAFARLFCEAFAKAYEEELKRLRTGADG